MDPPRQRQVTAPRGSGAAAWAQPRSGAAVAAAIGPWCVAWRADERCLAAGTDRRTGGPVQPRRAHRAGQSAQLRAGAGARDRSRRAIGRAGVAADAGHRSLQEGQRHPWPCRGRPRDPGGRPCAGRDRAPDGPGGARRRRGVLDRVAQLPGRVRPAGGRAHSQARGAPSGGDCARRVGGGHGERGRRLRAAMGAHHGAPVDGPHRPAAVSRQERRAQPLLPRTDRHADW